MTSTAETLEAVYAPASEASYVYLKLRAKRATYMRWSSGREATARSAPPARASPMLAGVAGHLASLINYVLLAPKILKNTKKTRLEFLLQNSALSTQS